MSDVQLPEVQSESTFQTQTGSWIHKGGFWSDWWANAVKEGKREKKFWVPTGSFRNGEGVFYSGKLESAPDHTQEESLFLDIFQN